MSETKRPLGLWTASALVAGSMIGSGAFLLPSTLAPFGAARRQQHGDGVR